MAPIATLHLSAFVLLFTLLYADAQLFSLLNARIQSSQANHVSTSGLSAAPSTLAAVAVKPKPNMVSLSESGASNQESLLSSATSRMAFLARLQQPKTEQKDRWTPLPNRHSELISVSSVTPPSTISSKPEEVTVTLNTAESIKQSDQQPHGSKDEIKLYNLNAIATNTQQQFHIGYIKASDLQKVIASGFQLRELRGRVDTDTPTSTSTAPASATTGTVSPSSSSSSSSSSTSGSSSATTAPEPLLTAAAASSGKTSPRKSVSDKNRSGRLQIDADLQNIAQKDISNQPINKESIKSTGSATRKSPVSPKQAHFGLRDKKQKLAQLNQLNQLNQSNQSEESMAINNNGSTKGSNNGQSGGTKAAAGKDNLKDNSGVKGKSNKSGKSRKNANKNLIAARTVPFGADLFSSTSSTTASPTSTGSSSVSTSSSTPASTSVSTASLIQSTRDTLSGSTAQAKTGADRETNDNEAGLEDKASNAGTDSLAEAVARSGKLVLAGLSEEEEEDDANNSLAAIAQQLNQNFGGFGTRNVSKNNHSNGEIPELRALRSTTKGGSSGNKGQGSLKGRQSESSSAFKSPMANKKVGTTASAIASVGGVKGRSRSDNKPTKKTPEAFVSSTIAPTTEVTTGSGESQTTSTTTPSSTGGTSTSTQTSARSTSGRANAIESEDDDTSGSVDSEADKGQEDSDLEHHTNDDFTLIGANLKVRNQGDLLLQRRNKNKAKATGNNHHGQQADTGRAGPTSAWNTDEPLDSDYEGFDDLNEVELIDGSRPAQLGSLRQVAPLQLSGCCSCAPLQSIAPSTDSKPVSIETTVQQIGANALLELLPEAGKVLREVIQQLPGNQFTVFWPSSDAVERMPKALLNRLKRGGQELRLVLSNHVLSGRRSVAELMRDKVLASRASRSSTGQPAAVLRVNVARNETATVNGQRLMLVDQPVAHHSRSGLLHLIDGLLYPLADRNLLDTLKACNKFDGFVTLAQGTGLSDILEQGGPYTVFVPSNDALQKIPDADLDSIRNNMTALKEFLSYHVVDGAFFSNDLKDGQFLPTLLSPNEIQVGVRVDQCQRRLIDANVSPLYRTDIPASNGVIHIVDWILKPSDHDWCENVVLPR